MTTTTFTARNLKKLGAVHTPELDFGDDGTNFKMFSYKGVPISYTKSDGDYYLSIRFDYVDGLRYDTYKDFPSYAMANDFNGVDSINEDLLAKILVASKVDLDNWLAR